MEAQISFYSMVCYYMFLFGIAGLAGLLLFPLLKFYLSRCKEGLEMALALALILLLALVGVGLLGTKIQVAHEVILQPDEDLVAKAMDAERLAKVMTRRGGKLYVRDLYVPEDKELIIKKIVPNDLQIIE